MKIVVTGSTGHISKPLITTLAKQGHAIVVISSNQQRVPEIKNLGAMPAIGYVEDVQFLITVLEGADAVYCMTPPNFSEPDQVAYLEDFASEFASA